MPKKSDKPVVEESTTYENFVGKKAEGPRDIFTVLGEEAPVSDDKEWTKHWKGMPAFEQNDNPTYKTMYIHFRNKEDFDEFCELYNAKVDGDQTLTFKTKSFWYPHLDREANALLRWIEEE